MKIMYFNARSIFNKVNDLAIVTSFYNPDIVIVCETWLSNQTNNAMISIEGYYVSSDLRKDREDTLRGIGGGLLVYIREGLTVSEVKCNNNFSQYCCFEIELEEDDIHGKLSNPLISAFYRSPNSSTENTEEFAELLREIKKSTLIVGDLNLPNIDWQKKLSDRKGQCVLDAVCDSNMDQVVNFTTHDQGNLLDVAFAQMPHYTQCSILKT